MNNIVNTIIESLRAEGYTITPPSETVTNTTAEPITYRTMSNLSWHNRIRGNRAELIKNAPQEWRSVFREGSIITCFVRGTDNIVYAQLLSTDGEQYYIPTTAIAPTNTNYTAN
jgi:hypothetical protein